MKNGKKSNENDTAAAKEIKYQKKFVIADGRK